MELIEMSQHIYLTKGNFVPVSGIFSFYSRDDCTVK